MNVNSPTNHSKSGFTLIELLVVIAIIAILAAILFPVFSRVREKARQISCLSNMKQLGLAFQQYTSDYDDTMPAATFGASGANVGHQTGGWIWYDVFSTTTPHFDVTQGSIYSYVKSSQVFLCPDDTAGQTSGLSYGLNSCTVDSATPAVASPNSAPRAGKASSYFDSPSAFMLLSEEDSAGNTHTSGSTNDGFLSLLSNDQISVRHSDGSNVAFVDGHSKWYKFANDIPTRNANDILSSLQTGGAPFVASGSGGTCP